MPVQSPNNFNLYMNTGIVNSHSGLSYNYDPSVVNNAEMLKETQCTGEFNLPTFSDPNQNYNAPFTLMQDNYLINTDIKLEINHDSNIINPPSGVSYIDNKIPHYNTNANCPEPATAEQNQILNEILAQPSDGLSHGPLTSSYVRNSNIPTSELPNMDKVAQNVTTGKRAIISSESEDDQPLSTKLNKLTKTNDDDEPLTLKLNKLAAKNKIKKEMESTVNSPSTNKDKLKNIDEHKQLLFDKSNAKNGLTSKGVSNKKMNEKHKMKDTTISHTQSSTTKIKLEHTLNDSIANSSPAKKKRSKSDNKEVKKEEDNVWKWWEEESREDGVKWNTLEHRGPVFAPKYVVLPKDVPFKYDGKVVKLSPPAEEVAGFYGKMLEHEYVTKQQFKDNFFKDWRKVMTKEEKALITDLDKCDFQMMADHFKKVSEERKNMSKEEKMRIKQEQEEMQKEYGFCILDGRPQKIGNYKIEPPSLFRGRGDHPKMGKLKKRIEPEDVIINCGRHGKIAEPPAGHKWKEVRHDNAVTWLASWTENVQHSIKYIMLNPSSKLKGEKDWMKYETARRLKTCVDKIRQKYREDWKSKVMLDRQRGVALYFIDKLALRAGNEKEEGETADTVGCCSLRVEHVKLHEKLADEEYVIEFDFLGKDCIRYQNNVPVEKRVFKNIQLFMQNKKNGDDIFDRLTTQILNKHLNEQMEGLTAKVFRTFNASMTLQDQLNKLTTENSSMHEKLLAYNRANRAVAILCNHQRTIPKAHGKQMENLQDKAKGKKEAIAEAKHEAKVAKAELKKDNNPKNLGNYEKKKLKLKRLQEQLLKLDLQATDKEENKSIALGTSKLNYLDPRITVAWCKKNDISVAKLYNKTQREKFLWAIEMATPDFVF